MPDYCLVHNRDRSTDRTQGTSTASSEVGPTGVSAPVAPSLDPPVASLLPNEDYFKWFSYYTTQEHLN